MEDTEKISGNKMFAILEKLKQDHTILNIHVMGTNYDGLTIILGVSDSGNQGFFIDYPGSAGAVAPIADGKRCYFQFSDGEKIQYSFKTSIDRILGKRIKFHFPEFIERAQRRNTFRVPVPPGVQLHYKYSDDQMIFNIINISEGGILIETDIMQEDGKILYKRKRLLDILIFYDHEEMPIKLMIGSAEIARVVKDVESGKINFGLKFVEINKDCQNELRRFIYFCQRRILQERGGFDE